MRPTANRLVIFVKEPRAGRVKTRLGRDVGMTNSAWWFRHQTARLLRSLTDPRWSLHLCIAPDTAISTRTFPAKITRHPQGHGNLGDRMRRAFHDIPPGPMLLIGSDVPGITPDLIAQAFRTLGHKDSVFGPAPDGGYWLVGMKRQSRPLPAKLFHNVRWSTEHALADTLQTLGPATIGYVAQLQDVDTLADLKSLTKDTP